MRRILGLSLAAILLVSPSLGGVVPAFQVGDDPQVEAIFSQMSDAQRVGQLFLVTAYGTDVGPDSDIATLITDYHAGGVVLLAANDNFPGGDDLAGQIYQMTSALQRLAARTEVPEESGASAALTPTASPESTVYVPLFIGIEYEGSAWPYTQFLSGVTPLPSNMALGATWNPALAESTGEVVGAEIRALGINLLLGPSADVVEVPQPFTAGDMGARVFGGEPFWVSQMIAAYVRGVHRGSEGHVVVVPRHFPGYGGADRLATVEIPTVRRSRDQLTQFDLKPFFAVTGDAADSLAMADGLLVGHIRYQGFQGDNLRLATRPISLDPAALQSLMSLPSIARWRDAGGLMFSDALGLRGVRRFYDPQELQFPGRRIALDAFSAGNDILYLGNFGVDPLSDQTEAVADVIRFFTQRYEDDPAFQSQVDAAVRRIIRKKLDLFVQFDLDHVIPDRAGLSILGTRSDVTSAVARSALTLLSPAQIDLLTPPLSDDNILIFTDTRTVQQCERCPAQPLLAIDELRSAILRFYGPEATGVVSLANISAFSFDELVRYLQFGPLLLPAAEGETPEPDPLQVALNSADWVIFVMLDVNGAYPASSAVKQFLAEPPVGPDAHVIVMAMGAPYYLDSTEVSKLTAYYALYSYTDPFVDLAARALFLDAAPVGALPLSVSAINYDILKATSPDPSQVLTLSYAIERATGEVSTTPTPEEPVVGQGDTLRLSTGVILDRNAHPVPDGTPVDFVLNYTLDGRRDVQSVVTVGGVAQTSIVLSRPGELRITVQAGDARSSDTLLLAVPDTGRAPIDVLPPDIFPTFTPEPTDTPAPPPTQVAQPTPQPTHTVSLPNGPPSVDFGDLFLAMIGLTGMATVTFMIGFVRQDMNYGLLLALPVIIVGLVLYNYYALLLPGAGLWHAALGDSWSAALASWLGGLLGVGAAHLGMYAWDHWGRPLIKRKRR